MDHPGIRQRQQPVVVQGQDVRMQAGFVSGRGVTAQGRGRSRKRSDFNRYCM